MCQDVEIISSSGFFLLRLSDSQNVARLAIKRLANTLERMKRDSVRLVFFQAPQSSVAYTGFLCQPIERSALLAKQFIDVNLDHCT